MSTSASSYGRSTITSWPQAMLTNCQPRSSFRRVPNCSKRRRPPAGGKNVRALPHLPATQYELLLKCRQWLFDAHRVDGTISSSHCSGSRPAHNLSAKGDRRSGVKRGSVEVHRR